MNAPLYATDTLEEYRQAIEALDMLATWLKGSASRHVRKMQRAPLGYIVQLVREDGRIVTSEKQLTLASAIRTALMIAKYP